MKSAEVDNVSQTTPQKTDTCTSTETEHVSRDLHWSMTAVGTTIALIALLTDFLESESLKQQTSQHKWAVSAMCIALALSWIALTFTIVARPRFVGSIYEGVMVCSKKKRFRKFITMCVNQAMTISRWLICLVFGSTLRPICHLLRRCF
jgi:predicted ferric reductase